MNKLIKKFSFLTTVVAVMLMASVAIATSCAPYCSLEAEHGSNMSAQKMSGEMSKDMANNMTSVAHHSNHQQASMGVSTDNAIENCLDEPCPSSVSGEDIFSYKINTIDLNIIAFVNVLNKNFITVETSPCTYKELPIITASKLPLFIKHSSFLI